MSNSTVKNTFSERIKTLLNDRFAGNTSKFSREIGVTPPTVGRWINDGSEPSRSILVNMAERLGIDLIWLITGEGSPDGHTTTQPVQTNVSVEDAVATLQAMIQESQPKLTEDEAFLLKEFRTLDADQKKLILRFLVAGFDGLNKAVVSGSNFKIENSFNGK